MILTKKVNIRVNPSNHKYLTSKGYEEFKNNDIISVKVEDLSDGSHSIIDCKCDICGKEKSLMYRFYVKNIKNHDFYACSSKCSKIKNKLTCKEKYGNKNYSNRNKFTNTMIEKYGVNNPSELKEVKDKRKTTMLNRHGVEYYVLSEKFKEKSEKTSLKNYGTIHPQMSDKMKNNRKKYYEKMGYHILDDKYDLYKREVYRLTKKVKKQLVEKWDGKDYYDNEYIKDNFNLPYYDGDYPTIDHKISIFEGFKNNIDTKTMSDISNLCLTKRCINSKKYIKTEDNFNIE